MAWVAVLLRSPDALFHRGGQTLNRGCLLWPLFAVRLGSRVGRRARQVDELLDERLAHRGGSLSGLVKQLVNEPAYTAFNLVEDGPHGRHIFAVWVVEDPVFVPAARQDWDECVPFLTCGTAARVCPLRRGLPAYFIRARPSC
jgi:hypothetical protein